MKIRFEMKTEFSEKDPHIFNSGSSVNRPSKRSHGVFRTIFNDQSGGHSYSNG